MTLQRTFHVPRYKLKEDFRRTYKGVEVVIPKGAIVEPVQEVISYKKRTHRVQVVYIKPDNDTESGEEIVQWVHKKLLATLR